VSKYKVFWSNIYIKFLRQIEESLKEALQQQGKM
jgi:hypothetical protein